MLMTIYFLLIIDQNIINIFCNNLLSFDILLYIDIKLFKYFLFLTSIIKKIITTH